MSSAAVRITNEFKSPTEVGAHYRLICMTGPTKGKVYYLIGKRIIIGRANTADIQIVDTKISREHAEISFAGEGYSITDLGSPNGVIINDKKIKQKQLLDGEKIVIGQTVFKYNIIQVSEANNMLTVQKGDKKIIKPKLVIQRSVEQDLDDSEPDVEAQPVEKKNPKLFVGIIVIGLVMYALFDSGDTTKNSAKKSNRAAEDSFDLNPEGNASKKLSVEDAENKRKFISILQQGQREVREGNYFRAIEDFNRALQLIPNNGQASYYLSKAKQKLDEDIEKNLTKGNKEYDSKKFNSAISSYCAIEELLQYYPSDERYLNAVAKLSAIEVDLGKEKGEIKCFEEKPAD
jgi:pSer/pThr/pTyr-binding forkhead associated (FHA) protein